ncbi:hypothetical protein [Paracraurococcus lichenis]|uniref:Uncharacterized protein n=1 Tax=Paracraurococcus lichenis TaxID=3064888 RepID=A0ABT9EC92_9PROT|nr:hypothetical protein [Paracraurococcus sp. LOR1-02]MDO9713757.1 hypothetical protein [Paracraurococcus sp. LOR1-02]
METEFRGTPPDPDCGAASPHTEWLRPRLGITPEQAEAARKIKKRTPDMTAGEIAALLGDGATEADVKLALATIRTRNPRRSRATLNATLQAGALVEHEARPGEPRWATVDRLLGELMQLRAVVAGLSMGSHAAERR